MEFSSEKDEKPIYIKTQNYDSIQKVWSDYPQYKQTSAGLNHYRRDVVIADFDASIEVFNKVFPLSGLPEFSYILINKSSGHVQAGYFLTSPFVWTLNNTEENNNYLDLIHRINSICPNSGYTGWRCKNPYFEKFKVVFNDIYYDKEFLIEKSKEIPIQTIKEEVFKFLLEETNLKNVISYHQIIRNIFNNYAGIYLTNIINNNIVNKTENKKKTNNKIKNNTNNNIVNKTENKIFGKRQNIIAGRNNYYFYRLWNFYRNQRNNDIIFSSEELLDWLQKNEEKLRSDLFSLNPTITDAPLSLKELNAICNSVKKYIDNYYDLNSNKKVYTKEQRELSLELRQIQKENKFIDFCDYMDGGVDFKEILPLVGIKKTVGYEYRKLYFELIENGTYYYFRESKGYGLYPFNMVHENQLKYPYFTFPEF